MTREKNLNLDAIVSKFTEKNNSQVHEDEFSLFMLQKTMGLKYDTDILPLVNKFKELDGDKMLVAHTFEWANKIYILS